MNTHTPVGDPVARAFSAYFRAAGATANQPSNTSGIRSHDGKDYVVLENVNGVLAVYRVRTSGELKLLRRWPSELEQ